MEVKHKRIINLSKLGLSRLEIPAEYEKDWNKSEVQALIADENEIEKIENLDDIRESVVQVSISRNKLTSTLGLGKLKNLRVLNLNGNQIKQLNELEDLPSLEWLSVSKNLLHNVDFISTCARLVHFDVSDNKLQRLPVLSNLRLLHTLLLHGNMIKDLTHAAKSLPSNLAILSLAENDIDDLNQVKFLAPLDGLSQLSIMNNPCTLDRILQSHYRPFVVRWCNSLTIIDGVPVTEYEKMKAEWLLSQGNERSLSAGQHDELVSYLASACPPQRCWEKGIKEDEKLNRIYQQEQFNVLEFNCDNMRYRSVDHSSRLQNGSDEKEVGMTDNKSSSPTFPINARVSEKEKRRRVHAWLGSQISSASSEHPGTSPSYNDTTASKFPTASYQPSFAAAIPPNGNEGISSMKNPPNFGVLNCTSDSALGAKSNPIPFYHTPMTRVCSTYSSPNTYGLQHLDGASNVEKKSDLPTKLQGTDEYKYSYASDVTKANAYTKKYFVSPSINTSTSGYGQQALSKPTVLQDDPSFPLPSKYDEYDMRPIKPLDAVIKQSMYGETIENKEKPLDLDHRPKDYLRSHSGSQATSKHMLRPNNPKENNIQMQKTMKKMQKNVETQSNTSFSKCGTIDSPRSSFSLRRKRQQLYTSDNSKKYSSAVKRKKKKNHAKATSTSDGDKENDKSEITPQDQKIDSLVSSIPVDLKHVQAATKIQAIWRGFRTRKLNAKVVEIRHEVRSRRAEQYISFLCHEVQILKDKLEAESKMRDLQTEAVRYIWSQVRMLQKVKMDWNDSNNQESHGSRRNSPDYKTSRNKSSSPRRAKTRVNRKSSPMSSPRAGTPHNTTTLRKRESHSSTSDFGDETESVVSSVVNNTSQKADVTWKDNVNSDIFPRRTKNKDEIPVMSKGGNLDTEETDEGRGTLVTDGEGNLAQSSAEDTDFAGKTETNTEKKLIAENNELKSTIDLVQEQVIQLQDAMLALSDQIMNQSCNESFRKSGIEEEGVHVTETQISSSSKLSLSGNHVEDIREDFTTQDIITGYDQVPSMTLKNILTTLSSPLSENELWALCVQACYCIKKMVKPASYIALDTINVRKDGMVEISTHMPADDKVDEMYLSPEALDEKAEITIKSSIFSLSVTLWSCADWEMSAEQAPQLSEQLESLLVEMSQDNVDHRAQIDDVIKICEDYHAEVGDNSFRVCASLFAESNEALSHKCKRTSGHRMVSLEMAREQETQTKSIFRDKVLPEIEAYTLRSKLKPASARMLSPRRTTVLTPHEHLMHSITSSNFTLRTCSAPIIYTVCDMFEKDPELVRKLNILPGQRRKNLKAMRLVMRRQTPRDPYSPPRSGIPTAPRALRAEVKDCFVNDDTNSGLSSVILRWHPAQVFDKHSDEEKPDKIIGYRIYVNGQPKGMVAGNKSRALLGGLRQSTEYRVHVIAVSPLGESDQSNTVIAHITSPPTSQSLQMDNSRSPDMLHSVEKYPSVVSTEQKQEAAPVPSERKIVTGPQPKPRLGAVFSKKLSSNDVKSTQQNTTIANGGIYPVSDDSKKKDGDDIIDRVLRRYGIQQTASIVPGCSSLPPMKMTFSPSNKEKSDNNNISCEDGKSGGDVTPRSMLLLTQLKNDLLN